MSGSVPGKIPFWFAAYGAPPSDFWNPATGFWHWGQLGHRKTGNYEEDKKTFRYYGFTWKPNARGDWYADDSVVEERLDITVFHASMADGGGYLWIVGWNDAGKFYLPFGNVKVAQGILPSIGPVDKLPRYSQEQVGRMPSLHPQMRPRFHTKAEWGRLNRMHDQSLQGRIGLR
jgi:hypothetical protein